MPSAVPTARVFKIGQARVYTSETLGTPDWRERPYLYCDSWRDVAGPDIGGGTLRYDYGKFDIREADLFTGARGSGTYFPLSIKRHYVKIEVLTADDIAEIAHNDPNYVPDTDPVKTFYGRIDAVEDVSAAVDSGSLKTGTQLFTVYDLKVELADVILRTTHIEHIEDQGSDFPTTIEIGQALGFNISPVGTRMRHGNVMPGSPSDHPAAIFSWVPSRDDHVENNSGITYAVEWKAHFAVHHLLHFDVPKDKDGDVPVTWEHENLNAIAWYDISIQREGRSSLDVLNELIDRRRLVGYTLEITEDDTTGKLTIKVKVFTFTATDIDMPGEKELPANADTTTLVAQTSPVTESIVIGDIATHQAEKVRVEGDPITVTFTLPWNETENERVLVDGWRSGIEDEYVAAAGGDEDANTLFRLQDKYEDVFSRIILSDFWNQKYERPSDGQIFHACIPVEDIPDDLDDDDLEDLFAESDDSKSGAWWHRGHLFMRHLAVIDSESKQYRPMFVLLQDTTSSWKYHFSEKLNAPGTGYEFACNVHTLPDRPGVHIRVNKQGGQQLIASGSWDSAGATPEELNPTEQASVNYENMLVTTTMEWDARCYAEEVIDDTRETLREIVIRVPGARLDLELPGCMTDLDSTGMPVESTGKVLRDDRERLRDIAKAASEWYGTARRAARLTYLDIAPIVNVGQFITQLVIGTSTEDINTPVTGVAYDFQNGRCFVETSYADADFSSSVERMA